MALTDWSVLTVPELLAAHTAVLDELRARKVLRSKNNPTGDYAEWIVSTKLGLVLETNSAKGYDATDEQGLRYQIKGRRVTPDNPSRQLGVIRNLEQDCFDVLIAVVFDASWQILAAAKIPHATVAKFCAFRSHVNGHVMHLRASVLSDSTVEDISAQLASHA
jgi:hypothetical protein